MLEKVKGIIEREDGDKISSIPERVKIQLVNISDIDKVYDWIKNDENFILETNDKAVLVVANPLSSKLENGELEIVANK